MPEPGWVTTAKVTDVYDGDTVVVEVTKKIRVRLLDCWAPEIRTKDLQEKQQGIQARDFLKSLIENKEVLLQVPTQHNGEIGKSISMSRVLGRIYLPDEEQHVGDKVVNAGLATRTKKARISK